ncbi:hypothetical protein [Salinispora arenicola]|uniref:hypothetical protein n=1 Tax=Salinispora arenicola TaxID=168697 RepID=UPI0016BBD45C|nr:hypothetical protein [Salinispora arenicola]NIL56717.1 hypothetical protein [Salinispora arenicola]NIL64313.1 hypothetical protein [Salinispora arenicola]
MAAVRITAPIAVTGKVAGVPFVNGVAEVNADDYRLALAYFRRHSGYRVESAGKPTRPAESPRSRQRS